MFRLALHLGMTVSELEQTMSSRELSEWYAFSQIEPWPEDKIEYAVATLSTLTANMNRKKHTRPYHAREFMMPMRETVVKTPKRKPKQTIEQMKEKFRQIAGIFR